MQNSISAQNPATVAQLSTFALASCERGTKPPTFATPLAFETGNATKLFLPCKAVRNANSQALLSLTVNLPLLLRNAASPSVASELCCLSSVLQLLRLKAARHLPADKAATQARKFKQSCNSGKRKFAKPVRKASKEATFKGRSHLFRWRFASKHQTESAPLSLLSFNGSRDCKHERKTPHCWQANKQAKLRALFGLLFNDRQIKNGVFIYRQLKLCSLE